MISPLMLILVVVTLPSCCCEPIRIKSFRCSFWAYFGPSMTLYFPWIPLELELYDSQPHVMIPEMISSVHGHLRNHGYRHLLALFPARCWHKWSTTQVSHKPWGTQKSNGVGEE